MNTDIEKLMQDFHSAGDSHDIEKMLSYLSDDFVFENPGAGVLKKGKEENREQMEEIYKAFPDFKVEKRSYFFTNNRVCWEWVMSGTHKGELPNLHQPATGKTFSIRGVTIYEIKDNKISRQTVYFDQAAMLRQLGLLPSTAGAA